MGKQEHITVIDKLIGYDVKKEQQQVGGAFALYI